MKASLFFVLTLLSNHAMSMSGNSLLSNLESDDTAVVAMAYGYLMGIQEQAEQDGISKACLKRDGRDFDLIQTAEIVTDFLRENTELGQLPAYLQVNVALGLAYGSKPLNSEGFCD
jgi:hypothetical protein|tara:strand:- start:748 stop:1095 length:348 start_codon:yes stop_codon:yes gene_type:complete